MRQVAFLIVSLLLLASLTACTSSRPILAPCDPALMDLAFLTGVWSTEVGEDGVRTEEFWSTPDAGTMLGVNRTIAVSETDPDDRRTVSFEFLRVEHTADDEIIYFAAPEGCHPPTPFRLVDRSPTRFVFENPEHDYPQTVIYEQQPEGRLLLRIEGVENGEQRSSEWLMQRARLLSGLTQAELRQREIRAYWRFQQIYEDSLFFRSYR